MLMNTPVSWGSLSKFFHWTVGILILCMLPLGFYMSGLAPSPYKVDVVMLHKSVGTLILFLVVPRLLWRLSAGRPLPLPSHENWEKFLAEVVHALLYLAIFTMILSGWIMTSAGDYSYRVFGLFDMPHIVAANKELSHMARTVHDTACYIILGLVVLHFAGAVKHHLIDRDATLLRMVPKILPRMLSFIVIGAGILSMVLTLFFMLQPEPERLPQPVQAAAAPAAIAAVPPATGSVQSWVIDPAASIIGFTATVDGQPFTGKFERMNGTIFFDPDHLDQSRADVTVDISSVTSGSKDRDDSIASTDWFNAATIPQAHFVSDRFEKTGDVSFKVIGKLTLRDTTLPVEMPFTLVTATDTSGHKTAQAKGTFTIKRSDYKIGQGEWADTSQVADRVDVTVDLHTTASGQ